jgi:hypothetical protein
MNKQRKEFGYGFLLFFFGANCFNYTRYLLQKLGGSMGSNG